jgi:hypothetical protein
MKPFCYLARGERGNCDVKVSVWPMFLARTTASMASRPVRGHTTVGGYTIMMVIKTRTRPSAAVPSLAQWYQGAEQEGHTPLGKVGEEG